MTLTISAETITTWAMAYRRARTDDERLVALWPFDALKTFVHDNKVFVVNPINTRAIEFVGLTEEEPPTIVVTLEENFKFQFKPRQEGDL